jgi:hypothetical protein
MRFIAPWSKATCLYCFRLFHLSRAPRRIVSPKEDKEEDMEMDQAVAHFLGRPPVKMGKVFQPVRGGFWKRVVQSFVLPDDPPGQKKICPHCHMYLPNMIASGEMSGEGIAIIGARNSGKSNYFGVLINALEKRYCADVGFTMFDQDSWDVSTMSTRSSRRLYRERYGDRLFNPKGEHQAISQTMSALGNVDLRMPLIYRLQFPKRLLDYLTHPLASFSALDLAIFDAAGEDMDKKHVMEQLYPFLLRSKGIIFLIDPFQYRGLRGRLPPEIQARVPLVDGDPAEVVTLVRQLFEEKGLVRGKGKIAVPVAFALSKMDLLRGLVYPGSPIIRDSEHRGGYNVSDCEEVSRQLIEYIKKWDSVELVNKADGLFSNYKFFAVSALGTLPGENYRLSKIEPNRVADPLLWLLYKRGYIGAARPGRG